MSDPAGQEPGSAAREPGADLRRRRDELAQAVSELQWNLGGLTYEMAIREHFSLDVLMRRAAMLQERDAELAEVERLLHMQESSVAGSCASCGAVRSRGAVFCWQCGAQVMERADAGGDAKAPPEPGGASSVPAAADVHEEIHRLAASPAQAPAVESRETGAGEAEAGERDSGGPAADGPGTRDQASVDEPRAGEKALGRPVQTGS